MESSSADDIHEESKQSQIQLDSNSCRTSYPTSEMYEKSNSSEEINPIGSFLVQIPPDSSPVDSNTEENMDKSIATRASSVSDQLPFSATPCHIYPVMSTDKFDNASKPVKSNLGLEMESYYRVVYFSAFAILGTTLRVFIGRLFGNDCELPKYSRIDDFLTPWSRNICFTSSGRAQQVRGAIFTDLPGNIIGCFIMGLLSSLHPDAKPQIPCIHNENQPTEAFRQALTVGLCGCLTTFAAWNGQMAFMLNGTETPSDLKTRIATVALGYSIGLVCSLGSFILGGKIFALSYRYRNPKSAAQLPSIESSMELEEPTSNTINGGVTPQANQGGGTLSSGEKNGRTSNEHCFTSVCNSCSLSLLLVMALVTMYLIADWAMHIRFYRTMWITSLLSPLGTFLRWKVSKYNKSCPCHFLEWFPWGTFVANLGAAVLFVFILAIQKRYLHGYEDEYPWTTAILNGLRTGFAGSLSTVSTLVKEITHLFIRNTTDAKSCYYSLATILIPMTLSLIIFNSIVT